MKFMFARPGRILENKRRLEKCPRCGRFMSPLWLVSQARISADWWGDRTHICKYEEFEFSYSMGHVGKGPGKWFHYSPATVAVRDRIGRDSQFLVAFGRKF